MRVLSPAVVLTSSSRSVMVSEIGTWFFRAVNQNSGTPSILSSPSFFSSISSTLASSSSSSSSLSSSDFLPASTSSPVGSALPVMMARRRSYRGVYFSRNWESVSGVHQDVARASGAEPHKERRNVSLENSPRNRKLPYLPRTAKREG